MRRIFAITSILALVLSMASPVWATACASMGKATMCHRGAAQHQHHCDMMMQQQDEAATPDSEAVFGSVPTKCPMQCCLQSQAGNGTAVLIVPLIFQLAVSDYRTNLSTVIFTSVGFSSHTDRGPPLS
jgi:hypothetical protein